MPSIELGVMRARTREFAGIHERREPGREDEDPLVVIDYGYLKLDGTEDDDDVSCTEQTAHLGCERCENWNLCCNLSAREKSL